MVMMMEMISIRNDDNEHQPLHGHIRVQITHQFIFLTFQVLLYSREESETQTTFTIYLNPCTYSFNECLFSPLFLYVLTHPKIVYFLLYFYVERRDAITVQLANLYV